MQVRLSLAILSLVTAFAVGAASSRLMERDAQAQSGAQAASVYVPAEGLAFRAIDGRVVARLSYDARGGAFEVYDSRERPSASLRAGPLAEALRVPAVAAPTTGSQDLDLGY
jgi:hypothetical protein